MSKEASRWTGCRSPVQPGLPGRLARARPARRRRCQPRPNQTPRRPSWRASCTASTSGRGITRRLQAGRTRLVLVRWRHTNLWDTARFCFRWTAWWASFSWLNSKTCCSECLLTVGELNHKKTISSVGCCFYKHLVNLSILRQIRYKVWTLKEPDWHWRFCWVRWRLNEYTRVRWSRTCSRSLRVNSHGSVWS